MGGKTPSNKSECLLHVEFLQDFPDIYAEKEAASANIGKKDLLNTVLQYRRENYILKYGKNPPFLVEVLNPT